MFTAKPIFPQLLPSARVIAAFRIDTPRPAIWANLRVRDRSYAIGNPKAAMTSHWPADRRPDRIDEDAAV